MAYGYNNYNGIDKDTLKQNCKQAYYKVRKYAMTFKETYPDQFNKAAETTLKAYSWCLSTAVSTGEVINSLNERETVEPVLF